MQLIYDILQTMQTNLTTLAAIWIVLGLVTVVVNGRSFALAAARLMRIYHARRNGRIRLVQWGKVTAHLGLTGIQVCHLIIGFGSTLLPPDPPPPPEKALYGLVFVVSLMFEQVVLALIAFDDSRRQWLIENKKWHERYEDQGKGGGHDRRRTVREYEGPDRRQQERRHQEGHQEGRT
jgi:hypothetical protein